MDKSTIGMCIFISLWVIGGILYYYASQDFHIEQVDCFDKNSNKINEVTCDKRITNPSLFKTSYPICLVTGIFVMGYSLYLVFKGK